MTDPTEALARALPRYWAKVTFTDSCWLWTGARTGVGYGSFYFEGKQRAAHRFAWGLTGRRVPPGLTLDHLCRVRHCVNPNHLRVLDNRTNILIGDSQSALNARKTRCIHGHPFTPENTDTREGKRRCRTCDRTRRAARTIREAEARHAAL